MLQRIYVLLLVVFIFATFPGFEIGTALGQSPTAGQVPYIADSDPCFRPFPTPFMGGTGGPGQDPLELKSTGGTAVIQRLKGFAGPVALTRFSPDSRFLATESVVHSSNQFGVDREVRLWDVRSGQVQTTWSNGYSAPAFSPDGRTIAMINPSGAIELWDLNIQKKISTIVSKDGYGLMHTSDGQVQRFYDWELEMMGKVVVAGYGLTFSPDGRTLAVITSTSTDTELDPVNYGVVEIWDVKTGKQLQHLEGQQTEKMVDGQMQKGTINGHADLISALAFSPNSQILVTAGQDGTLRSWDVATGRYLNCFTFNDYFAWANTPANLTVSFSSNGQSIANDDGGSNVYLWNAITGQLMKELDLGQLIPGSHGFDSVAFSSDLRTVLAKGPSEPVWRWDFTTNKLTGVLRDSLILEDRNPQIPKKVEFSPNDKLIAVTQNSLETPPSVWIWDAGHKDLTKAATSENMVNKGILIASNGNIRGAIAIFKQAQSLNPYSDYNLLLTAGQRTLQILHTNKEWIGALEIAKFVDETSPGTVLSYEWEEICWEGSLTNLAVDVYDACERAVTLAPDDATAHDKRGLARALTGNFEGATEDFEFAVASWERNSNQAEQSTLRKKWIAMLQVGQNPFDEETLAQLR